MFHVKSPTLFVGKHVTCFGVNKKGLIDRKSIGADSRRVKTITWSRWSRTMTSTSCVPTTRHHHQQQQQQGTLTGAGISSSTSSTWSVCIQNDVTEHYWHCSVFDELTNGQALMHYSRHRLTASVTKWLRARTRQPMTNERAGLVMQLVKN